MRALSVICLVFCCVVSGSAPSRADWFGSVISKLIPKPPQPEQAGRPNSSQPPSVSLGDVSRRDINGRPNLDQPPAVALDGQWFAYLRSTASLNANPMPAEIKQALAGWFDSALLDSVRFKIGDESFFYTADRIADPSAVTVIDVIVFRDSAAASAPAIWVHQLVHAKQARDLGTDAYVERLLQHRSDLEEPAKAAQKDYIQRQAPRIQPDDQAASANQAQPACVTLGNCPSPTQSR